MFIEVLLGPYDQNLAMKGNKQNTESKLCNFRPAQLAFAQKMAANNLNSAFRQRLFAQSRASLLATIG